MKPYVLIPIYNHGATIQEVVGKLSDHELPCLIVDDGSNRRTKGVLNDLVDRYDWVHLVQHSRNTGKGSAVRTGLEWGRERSYTHALQLDADGQHRVEDLPRLLEVSRQHPGALVLGEPEYGEYVPTSRYFGHKLSQVWVWVETLSFSIRDPLVGYRSYPVERSLALCDKYSPGLRMEFDPEIAVLYYWEHGQIKNVKTTIRYPPDGVSHFHYFWDNLRISWMHMRLFGRMLLRCVSSVGRTLG